MTTALFVIAHVGLGMVVWSAIGRLFGWLARPVRDDRQTPEQVVDADDLGLIDEAVAHLAENEIAYWYDEDDEMCEPTCEVGRAVYAVSSMSRELGGER